MEHRFTPVGIKSDDAAKVSDILQARLNGLIDLQLTLKHIHWNVVGPGFIAVHEMIDKQVDGVRDMADAVAERIATLGGVPMGLSGFLVKNRDWGDYSVDRAVVAAHLGALDLVYEGVAGDHREAIGRLESLDPVTTDLITAQTGELELYQWFVRAHLENTSGELPTTGADSELDAAAAAATADPLA